MNELAAVQRFVLYAALTVAVAVTLEWFETHRTRARATRRRRPGPARAALTATLLRRVACGEKGRAVT